MIQRYCSSIRIDLTLCSIHGESVGTASCFDGQLLFVRRHAIDSAEELRVERVSPSVLFPASGARYARGPESAPASVIAV